MMDKGGGGMEDIGEGMQCTNHPYRNNPGGICAFCLQEKLGKLVSSSKSSPSFFPIPPFSSSSSPSFRSEGGAALSITGATSSSSSLSLSLSLSVPPSTASSNTNNFHSSGRVRIPFSSAQKKAKKVVASSEVNNLVLKRSKSSAAPRRHHHFEADEYSLRKRGFWSFLHLSSSSRRRSSRERERGESNQCVHPTTTTGNYTAKEKKGSDSSRRGDYGDENESPNSSHTSSSSFGRKVARSRSVGCGSRSFSGDFLERISTGFGDCTLRRVESQREAKHPSKLVSHRIKERVKCGGIFGGFTMTSSSSTCSSEVHLNNNGRIGVEPPNGRSKSWGWAFASPMRAFRPSSKPDDKDSDAGKRNILTHNNNNDVSSTTNVTVPNLDAIPSLLTVRS